ncbi:MAG: CPBP family intramembrane metalloprotease [Puniceicoccales bacterium]|nr:CPBP family intramembrane metalloprotease [Puniceicoccales bacterium]
MEWGFGTNNLPGLLKAIWKAIYNRGFSVEGKGLCPLQLGWDYFFLLLAGLCTIPLCITPPLKNYLQRDELMGTCILNGVVGTLTILFLFWFCRWKHLPPINVSRLHFGKIVREGSIFFLVLWLSDFLWEAVLSLLQQRWSIEIQEQPLIRLLRSQGKIRSDQWLGIMGLVVFCAPIGEEIFFRYFLYRFCKSFLSPTGACFWTALVFAFLHFNFGVFFPLFIMGVGLVLLYERCGNLIPSIVVHGVFNFLSLCIFLCQSTVTVE